MNPEMRTPPRQPQRSEWSMSTRAAWLIVSFGMFLNAPLAGAVGFSLGAFANYGLLVDNAVGSTNLNVDLHGPIYANVGVGNINAGTVDLHGTSSNPTEIDGRVDLRGNPTVQNGFITGVGAAINTNVAAVGTAITAATNLSTTYGAQTGTAIAIGATGSTIAASTGVLDTLGTGTHIFTTTAAGLNTLGAGETLTIMGSSADYVVVNVNVSTNVTFNGNLLLDGGITTDHVLFNFMGNGSTTFDLGNGASIEGTFLMPNLNVKLNNNYMFGNLFGGQVSFDVAQGSGFIRQYGNVVPEPGTLALLGIGLAGFGLARRKRA